MFLESNIFYCLFLTGVFLFLLGMIFIFIRKSILRLISIITLVLCIIAAGTNFIVGRFGNIHLWWIAPLDLTIFMTTFILLQRSIKRPLATLTTQLRAIAQGDLSKKESYKLNYEFRIIGEYILNLRTFLSQTIVEIQQLNSKNLETGNSIGETAEEVAATIEEITRTLSSITERITQLNKEIKVSDAQVLRVEDNMESFSKFLEQEVAAVTQTSAAINQMHSNIAQMERNTQEKLKIVENLTQMTAEGETSMRQTVDSMQTISHSNATISELVTIINEIADQTSLLAMNASIEAAHAGDAGKGFSVVADEIGKLAVATSENARNISDSVGEVVRMIESTNIITKKTNQIISDLLVGIREVSDSMYETLNSINEVALGSNQILSASSELNTMGTEIQKISENIAESVKTVRATNEILLDNSQANTDGITEISRGALQINQVVNQLSVMGKENILEIRKVKENLDKFID